MKLTKTLAAIALSVSLVSGAALPSHAYPTNSGSVTKISVQVKTLKGVKAMFVSGTTSQDLADSLVQVSASIKGTTINFGTVHASATGRFSIKSSKASKPGVYRVTVAGTGAKAGTKTVITITVK